MQNKILKSVVLCFYSLKIDPSKALDSHTIDSLHPIPVQTKHDTALDIGRVNEMMHA